MRNNPEASLYYPGNLTRFSILFTLLASSCSTSQEGDGINGIVERVIDGDTFDVRLDINSNLVRIRMWGVDCPESKNNKKCRRQNCNPGKGKRVTKKVKSMIEGERVTLEPPYKRNGNRKLAYVHLDGEDFGRKLIQKCLCKSGYSHKRKAMYRGVGKGCR